MIAVLNRLVDYIEEHLTEEIDIATVTSGLGTTEYHVRRMFSSLAGMPLSEYIRRRRMSVAAADVLGNGNLLSIAVRFGYVDMNKRARLVYCRTWSRSSPFIASAAWSTTSSSSPSSSSSRFTTVACREMRASRSL